MRPFELRGTPCALVDLGWDGWLLDELLRALGEALWPLGELL